MSSGIHASVGFNCPRDCITLATSAARISIVRACDRSSSAIFTQETMIERTLGHLEINRVIATRYDQLAESFLCYSSPRPATGLNLSLRHCLRGHHGLVELRCTLLSGERRTWDGFFYRLHCWRAFLVWHSGRRRPPRRSHLAESCALA